MSGGGARCCLCVYLFHVVSIVCCCYCWRSWFICCVLFCYVCCSVYFSFCQCLFCFVLSVFPVCCWLRARCTFVGRLCVSGVVVSCWFACGLYCFHWLCKGLFVVVQCLFNLLWLVCIDVFLICVWSVLCCSLVGAYVSACSCGFICWFHVCWVYGSCSGLLCVLLFVLIGLSCCWFIVLWVCYWLFIVCSMVVYVLFIG